MFSNLPRFVAAFAVLGVAFAPAVADNATLLGVSKNWKAFASGSGADQVCYAISQPTASLPKHAKRDAIGFLINDWPGRKTKAEPEVVPGYSFKDGSVVTVQVGSDKFTFYPTNDGGSGSAWMKKNAEEARLLDALQKGAQATVTGVSAHGTMTHDTYSLAGLGDALAKIHGACSM